jgi:hypothetical protein
MPERITWTAAADASIASLRACGVTWDRIAASLGVSRNAALERARALRDGGAPVGPRAPRPQVQAAPADPTRPPLPPGHPIAWAVLTEDTCLAGTDYPAPDFSDRALTRSAAPT